MSITFIPTKVTTYEDFLMLCAKAARVHCYSTYGRELPEVLKCDVWQGITVQNEYKLVMYSKEFLDLCNDILELILDEELAILYLNVYQYENYVQSYPVSDQHDPHCYYFTQDPMRSIAIDLDHFANLYFDADTTPKFQYKVGKSLKGNHNFRLLPMCEKRIFLGVEPVVKSEDATVYSIDSDGGKWAKGW